MRKQLVEELRRKGISDERLLAAIGALPRHFFLDKAFEEWAYKDKPFPIGNEQTISQPYTVAYQTSLLNIKKRDKVLEVGTGSGYQAALLAMLGARVYTIERQEMLYERAKALLSKLRLGNIRCYLRDGNKGLPEFAPFDKIIVTAGAEDVPQALLEQLAIGGIMVIPVGEFVQKMHRITRISEEEYDDQVLANFRFVPLLKGLNKMG
ncbi:MAG: protein-L-isoaspartate(D-aspartate) O-methyltransferase [Phaeodactylibacter sp.]|nr:protein-L-isoaspartate(D-aspartate) O-methyltransferase [Phaeodactylibacter sp.]MCB9264581.1 protein-L-isoaspartate(D-aspartate) O-methyltransferase [Lewinellaceae bacterium]MCB9287316.1 protein-L-isoaspartate(D-aspartate) O-methyltransferase [Lewinellaceae bacterium]